MSETMNFECIDNQKFAAIAGQPFDQITLILDRVVYGITHLVCRQFRKLKNGPPCVLITSYSDASLTPQMANQLPPNVLYWFSTNVMTTNPRVIPIPIGFAFKLDHQRLCLERRAAGRLERKNLMYVNFFRHIARNPNPREGMYEQFGGHDWTTVEGGLPDIYVSIEDFYTGVQSHDYVLSPPGAGLDCHRHWEAMALGSIPIVLRSRATESLLGDMPCLIVEHWDEVTKERLEGERDQLLSRFLEPCMQKMDMNYWREVIGNEIHNLRHT